MRNWTDLGSNARPTAISCVMRDVSQPVPPLLHPEKTVMKESAPCGGGGRLNQVQPSSGLLDKDSHLWLSIFGISYCNRLSPNSAREGKAEVYLSPGLRVRSSWAGGPGSGSGCCPHSEGPWSWGSTSKSADGRRPESLTTAALQGLARGPHRAADFPGTRDSARGLGTLQVTPVSAVPAHQKSLSLATPGGED